MLKDVSTNFRSQTLKLHMHHNCIKNYQTLCEMLYQEKSEHQKKLYPNHQIII